MATPVDAGQELRREKIGFPPFLRYFLWLGTVGFGGPIASVGYMQRDLIEKRGWLDKQDFLNGIALGQTMPGPLAAQVAMWVGFLRRGDDRARCAACLPPAPRGGSAPASARSPRRCARHGTS